MRRRGGRRQTLPAAQNPPASQLSTRHGGSISVAEPQSRASSRVLLRRSRVMDVHLKHLESHAAISELSEALSIAASPYRAGYPCK
jgi:hypothetical protein